MCSVKENQPLVKLVSDLHFSHKPPLCRAEIDWYGLQEGYWNQLINLIDPKIPIAIAGDIFDRAQPPLECVNFVLHLFQSCIPIIYTVSGNHDLPMHALSEMHRSAYGILKQCQAVEDIGPEQSRSIIDLYGKKPPVNLYGFPCGSEVKPLENPPDGINVALVHDYIWDVPHTGYTGASEEKKVHKHLERLKGFDWAVYGDNHTPFMRPYIYNCGCFIRRKRDEINNEPGVGILYSDGSIKRFPLDTSQDKFTDAQEIVQIMDNIGAETFVEELLGLGEVTLDFAASIRHLLGREKITEEVKEFILRCLERARGNGDG